MHSFLGTSSGNSKKSKGKKRNDALSRQVLKDAKQKVWAVCKFIDDTATAQMLCRFLLEDMKMDGLYLHGTETDEEKEAIQVSPKLWCFDHVGDGFILNACDLNSFALFSVGKDR